MSADVTEPKPAPLARKPRTSRVVIPHAPRWYQRLAAWAIWALVRIVTATLRFSYDDRPGFASGGFSGPAIYCVWHNRLALCLSAYFGYVRRYSETPGMAAMVSASKDGGFLTAVLERFGVKPVRGSSSRRGAQALLELTSWADRGYDLAITPDGPRGPRYLVQDGVASLAQITGLPVVGCTYNVSWKITANSWDRFQVPLPFARCKVIFAPPLRVPRDASDDEREQLRQQLERAMQEMVRD
jgi:lysophospholipid acyltransferase (LPLAT)-like uncharacterized protein